MATPVIMPRQGQSVESCILVEWIKQSGDTVAQGEPLASIETDKAVFEVESPAAGILLECFFEPGADVPVLTHIAAVGEAGEDVSGLRPNGADAGDTGPAAPNAEEPVQPVEASALPVAAPAMEKAASAGVSPRARNRAAGMGIDPAALAGTGPGGRVIERDVVAATAAQPRMSGAAREAVAVGQTAPATGSGPGGMVLARDVGTPVAPAAGAVAPTAEPTVTPLSGIRKIIATKMHESLATTAQLTLNRSFDATALLDFRARLKAKGEAMGLPNITINDMIAFATVRVLQQIPALNAHFTDKGIVQFPNVNLGVAMDTPRGLMVPVLHGAERLSLAGLSRTLKPIIEACQSGAVNPDLLTGGTFTITNLGMLGIESFTPILNIPEVAILGVGGLVLRPVQRDGGIAHVQSINLSLTVNHQAVDGAPGARFLQGLCQSLEQFDLGLAG